MNVEHGVAIWVLAALAAMFLLGRVFASVNLSVGGK